MKEGYVMECRNLTKKFGNFTALKQIDLKLERGRIIGLLGPNGSGKTTLIKLLNGLLVPTEGEILVNGKAPCPETKAKVSYLPDNNYLSSWMSVHQMINYYGDFMRILISRRPMICWQIWDWIRSRDLRPCPRV